MLEDTETQTITSKSKPKKKKEFTCEKCFKVFGKNQHLTRHLKIHSRIYKCSKCNDQFDKWSLLQKHMKFHKFECFTCGKQLNSQRTLSMHLKTHDPSIVFPCSVCRKEFNRKQNLKVHYRTVHLGLKPFECVCGQSFGHKHLLQRHLRTGDGFHAEKSTEMGTNFSEGNETHKDMFDIPTTCTEIPSSVTEIPMQPTVPLQTTSILNDLTGFGHSRFSADRPIPCYVDQCAYRFKRIYDLQRHVLTYHSMGVTMDEELLAH